MALFVVFLCLLGFCLAAYSTRVDYKGSQVIRCQSETQQQFERLRALEGSNSLGLDFWLETRNIHSPVDMMVSEKNALALGILHKFF
jgi:hypothetical protein